MFFNKKLLYKGSSKKRYEEIINTLELNNIEYKDKIENKNKDKGPLVDKMITGTFTQSEDFSYDYSIFVHKEQFEIANALMKKIK